MTSISSENARKQLSALLERAYQRGERTIITRRGVPYAAIAPLDDLQPAAPIPGINALRGSGRDYYGDAARYVDDARAQWG